MFKDAQGNDQGATIDPEAGTIHFAPSPRRIILSELSNFVATDSPRNFALSVSELVLSYMQLQSLYVSKVGEPAEFNGSLADEADIWRVKKLIEFLNKVEP